MLGSFFELLVNIIKNFTNWIGEGLLKMFLTEL